jgi:hypothetical protein
MRVQCALIGLIGLLMLTLTSTAHASLVASGGVQGGSYSCSDATDNPASCGIAGGGGYAEIAFSGNAGGAANYGSLYANASANAFPGPGCVAPVNCYNPSVVSSGGSATQDGDQLTILGSPTSSGTLEITFAYYLKAEAGCNGTPVWGNCAQAQFNFNPGQASQRIWQQQTSTAFFTETLGYTSSTTNLSFTVSASASCGASNTVQCISDAAGYLWVGGIQVFDSQGNPVLGAQVISASGTNYNEIPAPVPLPAAALLLLSGLGGLGFFARSGSSRL